MKLDHKKHAIMALMNIAKWAHSQRVKPRHHAEEGPPADEGDAEHADGLGILDEMDSEGEHAHLEHESPSHHHMDLASDEEPDAFAHKGAQDGEDMPPSRHFPRSHEFGKPKSIGSAPVGKKGGRY